MPFYLRITVTALALTLGLGACSSSGKGSGATSVPGVANSVTIKNFTFTPKALTVKKGAAVTWNNTDNITHQVAIQDGAKAAPISLGGQTVLAFDTAGTFNYFCNIHNSMTGTVTVTG